MSAGTYASLNLGDRTGDLPESVSANRRRVGRLLPAAPLWLNQGHTNRCIRSDDHIQGEVADACVTEQREVPLVVTVADCLPLLLARTDGSAVAVAHVGWRGLAQGVIENTVELLGHQEFVCWLGPCIRACHYEVGEDVKKRFGDSGFTPIGDSYMMDIPAIAKERLVAEGAGRIFDSRLCTGCDQRRFYSHRRDGICGRMAAFIWLNRPG